VTDRNRNGPKSKAEGEKPAAALANLAADDSAFDASIDVQSGQPILKGTGELSESNSISGAESDFPRSRPMPAAASHVPHLFAWSRR